MFDFAWSEIALIAGVALVVIGPKDLPVAIRAVSGFVKKARRMAGEFQTHVDEMMKEADLKDVRDSLNEIRNFDIRGTVEKAVDPDRSLRDTFAGNPLDATTTDPLPEPEIPPVPEPPPPPARVPAPDFIPLAFVPLLDVPEEPPPPPSFIPPVPMLQRPPAL